MIRGYKYELRKSGAVVGHFNTLTELCGAELVVAELSILKQPYGQAPKEIRVPIAYTTIYNDGVDITLRKYLDVSRKSARQIEVLKQRGNR